MTGFKIGGISLFQFHKGTIKTTQHQAERFAKENFNSIKVRLKREFS